MLEFIIGMGFYYIYNKVRISVNPRISILSLTVLFIPISMMYFIDLRIHGITEKGIVAIAIFFPIMLSEMTGVKLKSKISKFFSDISYSLYLTHAMILKFYINFLKDIGIDDYPKGIVSFIMIFVACIITAYITHVTIEKWAINTGKKIIGRITLKKSDVDFERKPI